MELIDNLVVSKNIKHPRLIIRRLRKNKFVKGIFLLRETYGNDQFEIIQSDFFVQKALQKENLRIIGIASDYGDALTLAQTMLEDALNLIGEPDIKKYLKL